MFSRARHIKEQHQETSRAANSDTRTWSDEEIEVRLHRQIQKLTEQLTQAGEAGYGRESQLLVEQMLQLQDIQRRIVRLLVATSQPKAATPVRPVYRVGSMFLRNCQAHVLQGTPEGMHGVTGTQHDNIHTLDQMVKFEAAIQTIEGVTAKPESVFAALLELERYGYELKAVFHSHRFKGVPRPSDTDWKLQERLDRGGYKAIQCIFSEDGYMYWFGNEQRPFEVQMFGKGIARRDSHVFQFVEER